MAHHFEVEIKHRQLGGTKHFRVMGCSDYDAAEKKLKKHLSDRGLRHGTIKHRSSTSGATTVESVELDEISKKKLGQYIKKATLDGNRASSEREQHVQMSTRSDLDRDNRNNNMQSAHQSYKRMKRREKGVSKAVDRLTKEDTLPSFLEFLGESKAPTGGHGEWKPGLHHVEHNVGDSEQFDKQIEFGDEAKKRGFYARFKNVHRPNDPVHPAVKKRMDTAVKDHGVKPKDFATHVEVHLVDREKFLKKERAQRAAKKKDK